MKQQLFIPNSLRPVIHPNNRSRVYGSLSSKEGGSDGKEGGSDGQEGGGGDNFRSPQFSRPAQLLKKGTKRKIVEEILL